MLFAALPCGDLRHLELPCLDLHLAVALPELGCLACIALPCLKLLFFSLPSSRFAFMNWNFEMSRHCNIGLSMNVQLFGLLLKCRLNIGI